MTDSLKVGIDVSDKLFSLLLTSERFLLARHDKLKFVGLSIQIFIPSLSSTYFFLICARSLGVLDLSGTQSNSITAHTRNLHSSRPATPAGRSPLPPTSTPQQ